MRAVVERVSRAKVTVNGWISGEIGIGIADLLGVGQEDTGTDANYLAEKIAGLRIFEDQHGKMNRSVQELGGVVLQSQSSRCTATCTGKRTSFDAAAPPEHARRLYEIFVERICEAARDAKQAVSRK
jgi:D-aminoacyl-tRNA deacylase